MEKKLLSVINEMLENENKELLNEINPELSLRNDLGFDSLALAEFTVRIEDEFNIDLFEDGIIDKLSEVLEKLSRG